MPEYFVTITGYIDENKRPDGFPKEIHQVFSDGVESPRQLAERIMERTNAIVSMQGMLVRFQPFAEDQSDRKKMDTERMWVPMHMITHIRAHVRPVQGEVPRVDAEGKVTVASGTDIPVN